MGLSKLAGLRSFSPKLPTLRFRAKIMLGFAVVLTISAASMGIAYLGFERVSDGVATYRNSVTEADLARDIDRELISYRSLARYFVATGKEDDGKAALTAEAGLKEAIARSMKGTTNPARLEQVAKLEREFRLFSKIFADILRIKQESALLTQNQLLRSGNMLRYKLDDLPSNAEDSELQSIQFGAKVVTDQFQAVTALANTFVVNSDPTIATSAAARLKFVDNSLGAILSSNEKIVEGLKEAAALLGEYKQALDKLIANSKSIDELTIEMAEIRHGDHARLGRDEDRTWFPIRQRLESESNAIIGETERLILMLAAGGFLLGAVWAMLLGKGISRPMTAMCKAMRELAGGNFDVVLPGLGRKDELGEMAGAVEEFKLQAIAKAERDADRPGSPEQGQQRGAPRRTDSLRRRFRGRRRRHRLQRLGVGGAARIRGRHADANGGNHAEPVQPGRRRLGRSLHQHAVGRCRDRGACPPRSTKSAGGCANPTRSPRRRWLRPNRPTGGSANCRARRRRSATWSS